MGLLDKVKNFFYDEEDYTEEYEPVEVETKKTKKKVEHISVEEPRKRENKKVNANDNISEVELFKAEKTFNFPMDLDDTLFEKPKKEKDTKKVVKEENVKVNTYRSTTAYQKRTYPTEKIDSSKEPKKFTPTPIISPIYGVLNKNYKKEDAAIDSAKNYNITKTLDYDDVMKKAMKNKEESEDNKSIFFNLEEENNNDDEIKIIYNDVSTSEEVDNTNKEDTNNNTLVDEDNILSETKEQDLFNLIDNMYSTDDEEEDE